MNSNLKNALVFLAGLIVGLIFPFSRTIAFITNLFS